MACEDFPCCGHELGCCPDYDPETGKQLNMKCTCGAILPINNRYSICESCLNAPDPYEHREEIYEEIDEEIDQEEYNKYYEIEGDFENG